MENEDFIYDLGYSTKGAGHNSLNIKREKFLNDIVWKFKKGTMIKQIVHPFDDDREEIRDRDLSAINPFRFIIIDGKIERIDICSLVHTLNINSISHNRSLQNLVETYIAKHGIDNCEPIGTLLHGDANWFAFTEYGNYLKNTTKGFTKTVYNCLKV